MESKEHSCAFIEVDHEMIVVFICPIGLLFLFALGHKYGESK